MDQNRNMSLHCSSQELEKVFGLDVAIFFQYYWHLIILLICQFIVFLPFTSMFTVFDQVTFEFNKENNFYPVVLHIATDVVPAYFWSVILFANIFYFLNIKRQRMLQDVKTRTQYQIQDYAAIAYNISKNMKSNILFKFLEEQLGDNCIEDFLRVEDPSILRLRINYINLQKLFYSLLTNKPETLMIQNRKFYTFCSKCKVLQLTQCTGLNRDIQYYDNKLIKLKEKIEKKIQLKTSEKEGIIIVFSNLQTRENALKLNQKIKINKQKVYIKKAFNPDDTLYANISTVDEHRWRQQFFTFCVLIIVSALTFVGIKYIRDKQYQFIDNKDTQFSRVFVNGVTIFGIMLIPILLRPIFGVLVQLERHSSYSSYYKSKSIKIFIFTIFNKLSIIYFRGFSNMLENKDKNDLQQFKQYSDIFSPLSKSWRSGPNTTGLDLILIMFSYFLGYNSILVVIFGLQIFLMDKTANEGITIHVSQIYVANLVVFTLTECYAFQQPWMILVAVCYYITNYYLVKYAFIHFGKSTPKTIQISTMIEFLVKYINIGSYIAILQFTFNTQTIWWFLGLIIFIVLFNLSINSQFFNNLINKFTFLKVEYQSKQFRIKNNPSYQNICFDQYYRLPEQLETEDYLNMQYLIKSIKKSINENQLTGQKTLAWSKSLNETDYSLSIREPTLFIVQDSLISEHLSCDISSNEFVLFNHDRSVIKK